MINEEKLMQELGEIKASQARTETCLRGDEHMGHLGLVARMNNHAKRIARIERWILMGIGASGGLYWLFRIYVDLWPHK